MAPNPTVFLQGQGAVSADQLNTFVQSVTNAGQARTFVGVAGMQIQIMGFTAPGDGGQGMFYWNAGAINPVDDGGVTTIVPFGTTQGCWTRETPTKLSATGGYQYLQGSLILQWGTFNITSSTTASVSFTIPFPTLSFPIVLTQANGDAGGAYFYSNQTTSGFTANQANSATQSYSYMALGV